jgi:ring-1,2-phenylacetyl-CoA epoxidase subunit PaaC
MNAAVASHPRAHPGAGAPLRSATAVRVEYVLRLADSSLILGQRISEWCGHGPILEEDIALANVALDLIGQARLLLAHAGTLEGAGRDEDALALLRSDNEYRNVTLVELPNEASEQGARDFARTVLRNFLFTSWQEQVWPRLQESADAGLAAIAAKSAKETRFHVRHSADWVIRLGDGSDESHARMQAALAALWPFTTELFSADAIDPDADALQPEWEARVQQVLAAATLNAPARTPFLSHGKQGVHSEHLGHLLATMQYLQRAYPGARW